MRAGKWSLAGGVLTVAVILGLVGSAGQASAAPGKKLPPGGQIITVGGHPTAISSAGSETTFLVADGSAIDTLDGGSFAVGASVNSVTFDAFTDSLWAASPGTGGLFRVFGVPMSARFSIPKGSGEIIADPHTNIVWIAYPAVGTIEGFDESVGAVLSTISLGKPVGPIADDPQPETLWVGADHGYVFEVSEVSKSVRAKIPVAVGRRPGVITGVAVEPRTKTVWVTSYQPGAHAASKPGTLTEISAVSHKVIATMPVGPKPSAVSADPDTGTIWVTIPGENRLQLIDEGLRKVADTFRTGADPVSLTAEPATRDVWVSDHQDGTVIGFYFVKPTFHTRSRVAARVGRSLDFEIRANGAPAVRLTLSGALPPGVRQVVEPGTIKLVGTPRASAAHRSFELTVTAFNGIGDGLGHYQFRQHLVIQVGGRS